MQMIEYSEGIYLIKTYLIKSFNLEQNQELTNLMVVLKILTMCELYITEYLHIY